MTVRQSPRVGLEALRNLRRLLDATSPSPNDRSSIDRRDNDEKDAEFQRSLFDVPAPVTVMRAPQNIPTALLKSLVQALLTEIVEGQRRVAAVPARKIEVKS